jgi:lipoprotein NlpI
VSRLALTLWLCLPAAGQTAKELMVQAVGDFERGRLMEAVAGFDRVVRLEPSEAPHLWQRGIALYYVGRYADCRAQFESHRTVNPADVENAAWHFLCVARAENPEKAKAALLPVGPDPRPVMPAVYRMFRGEVTPEQVLAAAGEPRESQFYAHLYVGLYCEALGKPDCALQHLSAAAHGRYRAVGGYMHMVAGVHVRQLRRRK